MLGIVPVVSFFLIHIFFCLPAPAMIALLVSAASLAFLLEFFLSFPDRFPRASALLWRTLEEWIVDHYVTQYNQQLDEWMNAHNDSG